MDHLIIYLRKKDYSCTHRKLGISVSISFDAWSSDTGFSLLGVVVHLLTGEVFELKTLLLGLQVISNYSGVEQARVLLVLLKDYGIDQEKLGWFVSDNATNNDTALEKLSKSIPFDPRKKKTEMCRAYDQSCCTIFFVRTRFI